MSTTVVVPAARFSRAPPPAPPPVHVGGRVLVEQRILARPRLEEVVHVQRIRPVVAQCGLEHVVVGVDEAGQDDLAGTVDDLGLSRRDARSDLHDDAVIDQHVPPGLKVTHDRVHAQHGSPPAQESPGCHNAPQIRRNPITDTPYRYRRRRSTLVSQTPGGRQPVRRSPRDPEARRGPR